MATWFVYILRCADGSLYTGISTDPQRRLREHNTGTRLAARYTRARRPLELLYQETAANRAAACRREAALKKLPRVAKLELCGLPSPTSLAAPAMTCAGNEAALPGFSQAAPRPAC